MKKLIFLLALVPVFYGHHLLGQPVIIRSQAGEDSSGFMAIARFAARAKINAPGGVAVDKFGNFYFSNDSVHVVQKVTPDGHMSVFAGNPGGPHGFHGDGGPATAASLNNPLGLAFDKKGNLYICDNLNYAIRRVDTNGIITTVVGIGGIYGEGSSGDGHHADSAQIGCANLAFDRVGNMYFTDYGYHLRRVDTNGIITTYAGGLLATSSGTYHNGYPATTAAFGGLVGVAVDTIGNVYVSDVTFNTVRVIRTNDTIYNFAGNGSPTGAYSGDNGLATAAKIWAPMGLAIDQTGFLYIADKNNNRIRRVSLASDSIKTVAGTGTAGFSGEGGVPTSAALHAPNSVAFGAGGMFISDGLNYCIREVFPTDTLTITSNYGNVNDTVCLGYNVRFQAHILHQGYGDTLAWYKNSTWIAGNDTVLNWNSFANNDTIKCVMWAPGGGTTVLSSNKIIMTLKPSPAPIAGMSSVCPGVTTVSLADSSVGGHWSASNPSVASIDSTGILTIYGLGIDTIKYGTDTGSCIAVMLFSSFPNPSAISGPSVVCTGSSIVLSDSLLGGSWMVSDSTLANFTSPGILTGIATGSLTVTYTMPSGCYVTDSVFVAPLPDSVLGPILACTMIPYPVYDSTAGGTWSTHGLGASFTPSGKFIAAFPGIDTVVYTSVNGCVSMLTLNVLPSPSPIASFLPGFQVVCLGTTIALADSTPGGVWSVNDSTIVGITDSGLLTGTLLDTGYVFYTISNGCAARLTVVVDSIPDSIRGIRSVCVGSETLLTNISSGTWSTTGIFSSIADSLTGIVAGDSSGVDTITFRIAGGCFVRAPLTINPLPSPCWPSVDSACAGIAVLFTDSTSGGSWFVSDTTHGMIIDSTGVFKGILTGVDTVKYTIATGCSAVYPFPVRFSPTPVLVPFPMCMGHTDTLRDMVPGGVWSESNTVIALDSFSGAYLADLVGADTIVYTLPSSCSITSILSVGSDPAPIAGSNNTCTGDTVLFSDSTAGGVWSVIPHLSDSISPSGIFVGSVPGTVTVHYTMPSGCFMTHFISVGLVPAPIEGVGQICTGSAVTLFDSTAGGMWMIIGGHATLGAPGVINGVTAGETMIEYFLPSGCGVTAVVTINQTPATIFGDSLLCMGVAAGFTDTVTATGATWSVSDTAVLGVTATAGVFAPAGLGTAIVTYAFPSGCATTLSVTVNPNPVPIVGHDSVCVGSYLSLSDSTVGCTWSVSNTSLVNIDTSGMVYGMASGRDTVFYRNNATGCQTRQVIVIDSLPSGILGLPVVCQGSTVSLSDSAAGGMWTSTDTSVARISASGIVMGLAADTVRIAYVLPTGCAATMHFTVDATPAPITGVATLCTGHIVTLADASGGGSWSVSTPSVATIDPMGMVAPATSGTDTIIYQFSNGCLAISVITVNLSPAVITGPSSLCQTATALLTDGSTGGVWSSLTPTKASVNSAGLVTAIGSGVATIQYLLPDNCATKTTITVNPVPYVPQINLAPASPLCAGTMYQNFGTDSIVTGDTYQWSVNGALLWAQGANHEYALVSFPASDTAVITLSVSSIAFGCAGVATDTVIVNSSTSDTTSVVYLDNAFHCNDVTADSYQWGYDNLDTLNPTVLIGETNENYINSAPDFVHLAYWVVTIHGGCWQKTYYNTPNAIKQVSDIVAGEMVVYPNPVTSGNFTMWLTGLNGKQVKLSISDEMGRMVKTLALTIDGNGKTVVKTGDLVPGVYFLRAITENGTYNGKLEIR